MKTSSISRKSIADWESRFPLLKTITSADEVFWVNPNKEDFKKAAAKSPLSKADVDDADARLARFAAYLKIDFPDTAPTNGIIESPITEISSMKNYLEQTFKTSIEGNLWLKRDDLLPIAGTIKARGAIYEVLKHAEELALKHGMLSSIDEDYAVFASDRFKNFFANYKIAVGTTGNLGISVGTVGAKLGFDVTVHMSVEAKQWKKDFLRSRGVTVIEHESDFTQAVTKGRQQSKIDPTSYFVDDEHSLDLFLGYTVAANRLKDQLSEKNILVDADHPLFVYLPCGIGGSPGGITFGLKQVYGDHVHCFFAEPTHVPSMLIGLITGEYDKVSVKDFGLDGLTVADGLAVPRTSGFVAKVLEDFFSGAYTIDDHMTDQLLSALIDQEQIFLEPAALAGLPGAIRLFQTDAGKEYLAANHLTAKMANATHIAWATGGSMVPKEDMDRFYEKGRQTVNLH
ncbi:D-serine ammonia-lyase [Carnobacterium antarcticum]|uniref:Probable D-serine dehydratase n=1 Tax=Carnobacterium antarcticum TaxID=2126436 RepID=A0ABW4NQT5_9LACT|nr:D-serine ammonia-lyase [Carnobacterium sp. CP1]ALV21368.1 D-serine dehydratase [Carnobacterium sp. CP1]